MFNAVPSAVSVTHTFRVPFGAGWPVFGSVTAQSVLLVPPPGASSDYSRTLAQPVLASPACSTYVREL